MRSIAAVAVAGSALLLSAGATAASTSHDASVQAGVRHLVSLVGSCYARSDDYTQCATVRQLTRGGTLKTTIPLANGTPPARSGAIGVTAATELTFAVMGAAHSGVRYRLSVGLTGRVTTDCSPAGAGACPRSGHWNSGALGLVAAQRRHHQAILTAADATAKAHVGHLATVVDTCFATTHTFVSCQTVAQLAPYGTAGLQLVNGTPPSRSGGVGVANTTPTSFTLFAASRSGVAFTIARDTMGTVIRTCGPTGLVSCRAPGTW